MRTPVLAVDEIKIEYIPLSMLLRMPGNPKEHDLGAIAQSIVRFGFRDPIAVNRRRATEVSGFYIEEGHGRLEVLEALRERGSAPPRFIRADVRTLPGTQPAWLVPVMFFDDDTLTARGYALAHNRTQELGGGYDSLALRNALEEQARHGLLPGTGFDSDDLEALNLKLAETPTSPINQGSASVIVTCENEAQRQELIERLTAEGFRCRPGRR